MTDTIDTLFSKTIIDKYNINGPRYTSYPTALSFNTDIPTDLLEDAANDSASEALSIYIHIPFCKSPCYYCGCNKIVTQDQEKADKYLNYLEKEMRSRADAFSHYRVSQIHLGGGTPTFLTDSQQSRLVTMVRQYFDVVDTATWSIEADPRTVDKHSLTHLASIGYNRLSFGVQDIDFQVQEAINRVQSTKNIAELVTHAREIGFASINLDLIYGLPHQTERTFQTTLSAVIAMAPDRISLFSYAHLPSRFAAQRKINDEWLPSPATKLSLIKMAAKRLTDAGYDMIGIDHFALKGDELAVALNEGKLHRNFQGYTTRGELDLLGLGVSSISSVDATYGQNPKTLKDYYDRLDNEKDSTEKGYRLLEDDCIRRDVIMALMCNMRVDFRPIEEKYAILFADYFADALSSLKPFIADGLAHYDDSQLVIRPHARLVTRIIAMSFDAYSSAMQHRYSRVI